MRNFIQPGNSLAIAVPYATGVSAGQGVLVGALFGVAAVDGVQNAMIEAQTQGVFDLTKEPALAIAAGVRVFWDNTNRRITTTAAGNFQVGRRRGYRACRFFLRMLRADYGTIENKAARRR